MSVAATDIITIIGDHVYGYGKLLGAFKLDALCCMLLTRAGTSDILRKPAVLLLYSVLVAREDACLIPSGAHLRPRHQLLPHLDSGSRGPHLPVP